MTAERPLRIVYARHESLPEYERDDELNEAWQRAVSPVARERKKGALDVMSVLARREWPRGDTWRARLIQLLIVNGPNWRPDGNRRNPSSPSRDAAWLRAFDGLRKTKAGIWTADRCRDQLARIGIPDPHNQKVTLKLSKDGIRDAIKRARARESRQGRQYGVD